MINNMKKFDIDVDINGRITFEVEARNKNEAETMVDNVLLKCDYFGFTSKDQYILKTKRKKWRIF